MTTSSTSHAFVVKLVAKSGLEGEVAKALMANADRLLAAPPEILPAGVLAAKVLALQVQR